MFPLTTASSNHRSVPWPPVHQDVAVDDDVRGCHAPGWFEVYAGVGGRRLCFDVAVSNPHELDFTLEADAGALVLDEPAALHPDLAEPAAPRPPVVPEWCSGRTGWLSPATRRSQVSWCTGLSGSDREFPALTGRSGTQRTRACFGEHLIRRSGHIVQDRPLRPVCWTDIPQLSAWDASYPAAWQQCWRQSQRPGADPRPSAFQAWRRPSCRRSCECCAPSPIAAASRWLLLLLSPLLSVAANPQRKLCEISLRVLP